MTGTTKLSVEKVLNKLRSSDNLPKSKDERLDEKTEELNEEISRMKAQRLRLGREPGKPD